MGRSTLNPWWSDTRVHHHTWVPGSASCVSAKAKPLPESIWRQQRRTLWRSGSWDWAGSACRRLPSKLALCPTEWPKDGRERWWLPRILCLGAKNSKELATPARTAVMSFPVQMSVCYLFLCWRSWGWRPSTRWSRRCWWQWTKRCLNQGRSLSGAARPAAGRSCRPQTAAQGKQPTGQVQRCLIRGCFQLIVTHRKPPLKVKLTWMMMSRQIPAPISDGSPYMPVITYTMAWPMVMIIPNTGRHQRALRRSDHHVLKNNQELMRACSHFWAPLKSARSFGVSPTSIIFAPASSCMIRPEVTIGEIPSSIRVPGGRQSGEDSSRTKTVSAPFGSEPTSVWSQNDSHPVERICRVWGHDAKERDLEGNQSAHTVVNTYPARFYAVFLKIG